MLPWQQTKMQSSAEQKKRLSPTYRLLQGKLPTVTVLSVFNLLAIVDPFVEVGPKTNSNDQQRDNPHGLTAE